MALLSDKLAAARRNKGLTQQEAAVAAGLSVSVVAQLERGAITDPRIKTLQSLGRVYGVSILDLLDDEEPPAPEKPKRRRKR
jgi:transcriptional regulator with XRE-family HTH domain